MIVLVLAFAHSALIKFWAEMSVWFNYNVEFEYMHNYIYIYIYIYILILYTSKTVNPN